MFRRLARNLSLSLSVSLPVMALALGLAATTLVAPADAAKSPEVRKRADGTNLATPRNFTGYGFDQCLAPDQESMNAWLRKSPFWAVGIYISGKSRACRSQPNLTPDWISTQLDKGWRLLPITLGPQASCSTRFPRYGNDPTIDPTSADNYAAARRMGRLEADDAVAAATALTLTAGSTLWYDLEAFDIGRTKCRDSAMWFLSAWTKRLHKLGFVSGAYSSAASGIKAMDDVRREAPKGYVAPDRLWIADWNGRADVLTSYIPDDGWMPGNRMHQYQGGHNETWGGVTINIDRNFLDLGTGSVAGPTPDYCNGTNLDLSRYRAIRPGDSAPRVSALQCLLSRLGAYDGELTGTMDAATQAAVTAFRAQVGLPAATVVKARVWTALHAAGKVRLVKYGAASELVRRLQRALAAANSRPLEATGVFEAATADAVEAYQARLGRTRTGVVTPALWRQLQRGVR